LGESNLPHGSGWIYRFKFGHGLVAVKLFAITRISAFAKDDTHAFTTSGDGRT